MGGFRRGEAAIREKRKVRSSVAGKQKKKLSGFPSSTEKVKRGGAKSSLKAGEGKNECYCQGGKRWSPSSLPGMGKFKFMIKRDKKR